MEDKYQLLLKNMSVTGNELYNLKEVKELLIILKVIYHPRRHQILELINQNEKMTISEISFNLKISQSMASSMLNILHGSRLVKKESRDGIIYFSIINERLNKILKFSREISKKPTPANI